MLYCTIMYYNISLRARLPGRPSELVVYQWQHDTTIAMQFDLYHPQAPGGATTAAGWATARAQILPPTARSPKPQFVSSCLTRLARPRSLRPETEISKQRSLWNASPGARARLARRPHSYPRPVPLPRLSLPKIFKGPSLCGLS